MRRKRRAARRRPPSGGPQFNVRTLAGRTTLTYNCDYLIERVPNLAETSMLASIFAIGNVGSVIYALLRHLAIRWFLVALLSRCRLGPCRLGSCRLPKA